MAETLTLIEKTVHMKSSEVFRAIPTEPLAQLAARANELQLDRGETVFREGDDDQGVFIVIEGVIELRKGDAVVRVLRSGTVHGELFLQESESHQYTAIAREDARVLNLGRNDVFDALLEYPEFGVAMVQDLALRHHKLTERVIELEQQLRVASGPIRRTRPAGGHRTPGAGSNAYPNAVAGGGWPHVWVRNRRLWRISQGQSLGGLPASPRRFHHLIIKIAPATAAPNPGFGRGGGRRWSGRNRYELARELPLSKRSRRTRADQQLSLRVLLSRGLFRRETRVRSPRSAPRRSRWRYLRRRTRAAPR